MPLSCNRRASAPAPQGVFERELPWCDSLELFRRLRRLPMPVLLASGSAGAIDILAAAPARVLSTRGDETVVRHAGGRRETLRGNPLDLLRQHFDYPALDQILPPDMPFAGGAIGYFAYDLLHGQHRIPAGAPEDIPLPAMRVGIYHWAVLVDRRARRCRFVALPCCAPEAREQALACLAQGTPEGGEPFALDRPFRSNFSRDDYLAACGRVIDYIHAGDCYQVNLSQRFSAGCRGDSWAAFEKLHRLADAPFSAYLEGEDGDVLSFSPERFIQVQGDRVVTQPIKGTRPRDADPARDRELLRELLESPKDRAENLMIVDLLRNDLGRVCRTGSVSVPRLFETQSFRNVHHLVSTIEGRLERPADLFELLKAGFPGGSITGTPKIRAMEIISELETRPRSVYCGSVAWIGVDGAMDSNICIRTLVRAGGRIHCWGGGGIVSDSVPAQEYQETLDKISIFINNL